MLNKITFSGLGFSFYLFRISVLTSEVNPGTQFSKSWDPGKSTQKSTMFLWSSPHDYSSGHWWHDWAPRSDWALLHPLVHTKPPDTEVCAFFPLSFACLSDSKGLLLITNMPAYMSSNGNRGNCHCYPAGTRRPGTVKAESAPWHHCNSAISIDREMTKKQWQLVVLLHSLLLSNGRIKTLNRLSLLFPPEPLPFTFWIVWQPPDSTCQDTLPPIWIQSCEFIGIVQLHFRRQYNRFWRYYWLGWQRVTCPGLPCQFHGIV